VLARRWQRLCHASCVAVWVSVPLASLANGRFPRAERLFENPDDPNQLTLAATYGIVTTKDRGRSWYHVCEASFSLMDSYLGDPLLDFSGDRTMLVGVQASLNVSHADGCEWRAVLGGGSVFVIDYSVARSQPSTIVAVLADYQGGSISYSLTESTDNGSSWQPIGGKLPAQTVYTVDLDPLDPTHVYVSGLNDNVGQLLSSADHGMTWSTYTIPSTDVSSAPYIAAVHPTDPRKIFVRTDGWTPIDGDLTANDALLYSSDGGATWTELLRNRAKLYGFALSPDASTVLVGFGDPQGGAGEVVSGMLGVFESAVDPFAFRRIFAGHVGCLTWTKTGLYLCASQYFDGFELAFAPGTGVAPSPSTTNLAFDGGGLSPLLRLDEIKGPLECGTSTPGFVCKSNWDQACIVFGACGKTSDAGAPVNDAAAPIDDANTPESVTPDGGSQYQASGGCACRAASRPERTNVPLLTTLSLAALCLGVKRPARRRAEPRITPC